MVRRTRRRGSRRKGRSGEGEKGNEGEVEKVGGEMGKENWEKKEEVKRTSFFTLFSRTKEVVTNDKVVVDDKKPDETDDGKSICI